LKTGQYKIPLFVNLTTDYILQHEEQYHTMLHSSKHVISPNGQKQYEDDPLNRIEKLSRTYNAAQPVEWLDRFTFQKTKQLKREKLLEKKRDLYLNIELPLFDNVVMVPSILVC
jgi:uncharacterized protein YcbK (DUF882 family)